MFDIDEAEEDVVSIADVKPKRRCPKCSSLALQSSTEAETSSSFIGASLYALTQTCIMCGWSKTYGNVKLGV